jgi:ABC-2 type transport system ATP-binding protein
MVAVGPVDELRAVGPRRFVVESQAASGWATGLPGVRVLSSDNGKTELELADGADDQAVLRAALAAGPVRGFGDRRPSLTELFRDVVSEVSA